jgi:hypothetical protein
MDNSLLYIFRLTQSVKDLLRTCLVIGGMPEMPALARAVGPVYLFTNPDLLMKFKINESKILLPTCSFT